MKPSTPAVMVEPDDSQDETKFCVPVFFTGDGGKELVDVRTWSVYIPILGISTTLMGPNGTPHSGRIEFGRVLPGLVDNIKQWVEDPQLLAKVRSLPVKWVPQAQGYIRPLKKDLYIDGKLFDQIVGLQA